MATLAKRTSRGKQKIPMARIADEQARRVCFCKRRDGLFKKASELSVLCGTEIAIVVFSPSGKVFSFGHPSVIDRFLAGSSSTNNLPLVGSSSSDVGDLYKKYAELKELTLAAERENDRLKEELRAMQTTVNLDVETMGPTERMELERKLVDLKRSVDERCKQLTIIAAPPPMEDLSCGVKKEDKDDGLPPLPPSLDGFDYGHHHGCSGSV